MTAPIDYRIVPVSPSAHLFMLDGGPAQEAGLAAGDVIIAVDGIRVSRGACEKLLATYQAGATVRIHAFRRDELMEFPVVLTPAPADTCVLTFRDDVDDATLKRRAAWLGCRTEIDGGTARIPG